MAALSNSPCITIGDVVIQQDDEGRYSLKDLHQASGGEKRHQPGDWMRIQQTQDLIAELQTGDVPGIPGTEQKQPVKIIRGGDPKKQGTYVVRELVYAYAMWISPSFHLKVIRTFDAVMTGHVAAVETLLPSEVQTLHEVIDRKAASVPPELKGRAYGEIYTRLQNKFRVNSYKLLPRAKQADALVYVATLDLRCAPSTPVDDPNDYERINTQQYSQLMDALRPGHWLLQSESTRLAIHDEVRCTFNIRHLKDLPADDFKQAMWLAQDINRRAGIVADGVGELLQYLVRNFIAAGAPCTLVLVRQYAQQFKAKLPERPNWLEIQQQLQSAKLADPEKSHAE